MKLLFDIFPILVFFICYKIFGLYVATAVAMAASVVQVLLYRLKHSRFERMHLISMTLILILGSATLFFQNPWFIKWKPTGIYWLSAVVFLYSMFFSKKTVIQKMMESSIILSEPIWRRLNLAWCLFFIVMGSANLYVAYRFDTDTWVSFKMFGGIGFTLLFVFIQAFYLAKHLPSKNVSDHRV